MLTIHNPNEDNPPAYFKFFVALDNSELPRRKKRAGVQLNTPVLITG